MNIKSLVMSFTFFAATNLNAAGPVPYYRVWQGFQNPALTKQEFQQKLPWFMNETRDLYTGVLNNYLVVLPPATKPAYVPDEFALVALNSEEDYQRIRATERGRSYSEAHWVVFNKENSKSAPYNVETPTQLKHNQAYDLIRNFNDWSQGHRTFFIGLRRTHLSSENFLTWLSLHVQEAASVFKSRGLKGYIVIANENYEAAYMNWTSQEAMEAAFSTPEGQKIIQDSRLNMDLLMFKEASPYDRTQVQEDRFYDTSL